MPDVDPSRTDSTQPPGAGAEVAPAAVSAEACPHCGAPLAPDAQVCPSCGRKQFRTCFCGTPIRTDLARCPVCDADWSSKTRIRRRSRSVHVRPRTLLRSAFIGAFITVVGSAILNLVISAMAERSMPAGMHQGGIGVRLYYAGQTLYEAFGVLSSRLLGGAGAVGAAAVAGALLGVLLYLLRAGYWRKRHRKTHTPTRRRRSR